MTPEQKLADAKVLRRMGDEAWERGQKSLSTAYHAQAANLEQEAKQELLVRAAADGSRKAHAANIPLFKWFWSEEARKRMGLDKPREGEFCINPIVNEPYDRVAVLGVEMSIDELRGVVQHMLDEYRERVVTR